MKQVIEKHEKCKKKNCTVKSKRKKDERECRTQKRKKGKYKNDRIKAKN